MVSALRSCPDATTLKLTTETEFALDLEFRLFLQPLPALVACLTRSRLLSQAWYLIESEFSNDELDLDRAADFCGISKNRLNLRVRELSLFTFHALLLRYRLFQSTARMADREYALTEIAFDCGFGTLRSFERAVKQILGASPTHIRDILLKEQTPRNHEYVLVDRIP
ncbi:MAG: helix-turn-helix domain-containing protein [Blastocatellia bacterium]